MKRRTARLSINRETIRRLTADQLEQVAGGKFNVRCTYEVSGCILPETRKCPTCDCPTVECTGGVVNG